jgi:hypothetical protein
MNVFALLQTAVVGALLVYTHDVPVGLADSNIQTTVPSEMITVRDATGQLTRRINGMESTKVVHEFLLSCLETRSLDLHITSLGCSVHPDRWNFPFRLSGGDVYPNLTSLRLAGYRFTSRDWDDVQLSSFYRDGLWDGLGDSVGSRGPQKLYSLWRDTPTKRRHLSNLELWLEAMDWTKLESLALLSPIEEHFVELATPHLKSLKSLEVYGDASRLIYSLPEEVGLEYLSVNEWTSEMQGALLDRHGQTLKTLKAFSVESGWERNKVSLTPSQLQAIATRAPNVEHLSMNLDRNGSWPWEVVEALAIMPSMVSTDIWLELAADCIRTVQPMRRVPEPCRDGNEFRHPRLNAASATEIFTFLRDRKAGTELQRVTFHSGDWSRTWDGALYVMPWIEERMGQIECDVYSKDGGRKKVGEEVCVHIVDDEGRGDEMYYQWPRHDLL